jgi:plastocyanin
MESNMYPLTRLARRFALCAAFSLPALFGTVAGVRADVPLPGEAVQIRAFAFVPPVLKVAPGTTVTWTNEDDEPHTVTATDKTFRSSALDGAGKYSFTFRVPGDYSYFCALHPHMTGHIVVGPDAPLQQQSMRVSRDAR